MNSKFDQELLQDYMEKIILKREKTLRMRGEDLLRDWVDDNALPDETKETTAPEENQD